MNYTSIEQSKKLLELGLKPETADMNHYEKDDGWVTLPKGQISYGGFQIIPCWSLGALLGIMPCIPNCTILFAILDGKYGICITPLDSGLALSKHSF